ncbi:MAG: RusA family crossover junction endodeoxyribonuclease [Actinomycetota bacterium]
MSVGVTFTLEGRIPSKKNSRVKPKGKDFTVPSNAYQEWQKYARWEAKRVWRRPPTGSPVRLEVVTSCRNDLDNLVQSVMDALQGIVYKDDRQVVEITGRKVPKERREYRTEVIVEMV